MECFNSAVIAVMKWEEIGNNPERVSKLRRYEGDFKIGVILTFQLASEI